MEYSKVKGLVTYINSHIKGLYVIGSFRRKEKVINDLDFATKLDLDDLLMDFDELFNIKVLVKGDKYMSFELMHDDDIIEIDIWRANGKYEYKFLKWMGTLDKAHNIAYRKMAKGKGYKLSDNGMYNVKTGQYVYFNTIKELKDFLKQ